MIRLGLGAGHAGVFYHPNEVDAPSVTITVGTSAGEESGEGEPTPETEPAEVAAEVAEDAAEVATVALVAASENANSLADLDTRLAAIESELARLSDAVNEVVNRGVGADNAPSPIVDVPPNPPADSEPSEPINNAGAESNDSIEPRRGPKWFRPIRG